MKGDDSGHDCEVGGITQDGENLRVGGDEAFSGERSVYFESDPHTGLGCFSSLKLTLVPEFWKHLGLCSPPSPPPALPSPDLLP